MASKKQQGTSKVALIVIIVVIAGVLWYAFSQKEVAPVEVVQDVQKQTETIQSESDLSNTSDELDGINVDSLDHELNQNDTDAATF